MAVIMLNDKPYSSRVGATVVANPIENPTISLERLQIDNVVYSVGGDPYAPDGRTITPVADVPTWLRCIRSLKSYTTLSEVLADLNLLNELLTNANSINYLVRSTVWADVIAGDEQSMTLIGNNDYAAYALTHNGIWSDAIGNSEYFELVLNSKVPLMTSATTPSGVASAGSQYDSTLAPWKAFNRDNSDANSTWMSLSAVDWVQYQFTFPLMVQKTTIGNRISGNADARIETFTVQGSNDGINFEDITDAITRESNTSGYIDNHNIFNQKNYSYYRINCLSCYGNYTGTAIVQFYGRAFGDVQSWLKAAGLERNYTTLGEVLADSTALMTLMSTKEAVDYLSACVGWADTICENQNAMTYIGLNNYASDTLLNIDIWKKAILHSGYFDLVLKPLIPTMVSDNSPEGEASANSNNDIAYLAFDGNDSTGWLSPNGSSSGQILKYAFPSTVRPYKIRAIIYNSQTVAENNTYIVKGSMNDVDYTNLMEAKTISINKDNTTFEDINTIFNENCLYIYIARTAAPSTSGFGIKTLQIYGRDGM